MTEKGMTDFLSYNIYLTRWKETEVRAEETKESAAEVEPDSTCSI